MALSDGEHSTLDELWRCFSFGPGLVPGRTHRSQTRLNEPVSALGTTYARTALALPVLAIYPLAGLLQFAPRVPAFSPAFLFAASCGAAIQVASTPLLIELFRKRGFAGAC
jgi:hypothetical protein